MSENGPLARFLQFSKLGVCFHGRTDTVSSDPVKMLAPNLHSYGGNTRPLAHRWWPCCLWLRLVLRTDPNKWKPDPRGFSGMEKEGRASWRVARPCRVIRPDKTLSANSFRAG